jgi:hypothetical protein
VKYTTAAAITRAGVDDERHPQTESDERAADEWTADGSQQEGGRIQAGDTATTGRRTDPDQQSQCRHREHRRADAAESAKEQQLPVRLGQSARTGGHRNDQQSDQVHGPLAEPLHQSATGGCEQQPHEGECTDDRRRRGVADAEFPGELWQSGRDDAESERDDERRGNQNPDLRRELASGLERRLGRRTVVIGWR